MNFPSLFLIFIIFQFYLFVGFKSLSFFPFNIIFLLIIISYNPDDYSDFNLGIHIVEGEKKMAKKKICQKLGPMYNFVYK